MASGGDLDYRMMKRVPGKLRPQLEAGETFNLILVTGVVEHGCYTCSGYQSKDTGKWQLIKRAVHSDGHMYEAMMNQGVQWGTWRLFHSDGKVTTCLFRNGEKCGQEVIYRSDGTIESRKDRGPV